MKEIRLSRLGCQALTAVLLLTMTGVFSAAFGATLSLEQCLDLALRNSPELARSEQQVYSAQAGVLGAYGSFLPNVSTSFGYSHQFVGPRKDSQQFNTITQEFFTQTIPSRDYESFGFNINSDLTLFSGFSRWAGLKSSQLNLSASRMDAEITHNQVESAVIQAYYRLVSTQMTIVLNESSLEAAREQYEQSKRAFSMGAVARSDTLSNSVTYAERRLALLESENQLDLDRLALATVIGMDTGYGLAVEMVGDSNFIDVDREDAMRAALAAHPELRAADFRREAAQQDLRSAKAALWPSVSASYRYGWNNLEFPDELGEMFDTDYSYTLTLGMSWSIFDAFRTKRNINQSRASARMQDYTLEQQRRSISQAVEGTLVTLTNSRKRVELAGATIELADENLRLARERYRVGAATLLEVTEAEVSVITGRKSRIDGLTSYLTALAELERMTGLQYH